MTEEELRQKYEAALAQVEIATRPGIAAATVIVTQAQKEGIKCALAGGIAMHVYGYQRATKDVDLLASGLLTLPAQQQLSFGGASYLIEVGGQQVVVDVIVRDDFFRVFYEAALNEANPMTDGLRIVSAEWMVILKYLAGRSKDILDLLWLLQEPDLVDRNKIAQSLKRIAGTGMAQAILRGLEAYYVQAEVMRTGDENGKEK